MYLVFKSVLFIVAVAYVTWGIVLLLLQSRFLYYPVRELEFTPADVNLSYEDMTFQTADGVSLNGWFLPADGAQLTVLFCHGNGGNISHRLDSLRMFNELGVNVFVFDYRGYGKSGGKPGEKGTYMDVEAACGWLVEQKGASPESIIVFGRSLGASIAAYLASRQPVRGLVLESAFTSFVDIGKKFYPYMPVRVFARYSYPTLDYVRKVRCPVMVIHSRTDELVPFDFGRRLYEAANEPKEFAELLGGHNDGFIISGRAYVDAWRNWLQKLSQPSAGDVSAGASV